MFISSKEYDRVNKRNVKLARQARDLTEENHCLYRENRDLRYENEELRDTIKDILKQTEINTYSNDRAILGKINELATTAINN